MVFPGGTGVKGLPAGDQEMQVQSLGQEDSLKTEMATHSSILARIIPWTEEAGRLCSLWAHKESDAIEAADHTSRFRQAIR